MGNMHKNYSQADLILTKEILLEIRTCLEKYDEDKCYGKIPNSSSLKRIIEFILGDKTFPRVLKYTYEYYEMFDKKTRDEKKKSKSLNPSVNQGLDQLRIAINRFIDFKPEYKDCVLLSEIKPTIIITRLNRNSEDQQYVPPEELLDCSIKSCSNSQEQILNKEDNNFLELDNDENALTLQQIPTKPYDDNQEQEINPHNESLNNSIETINSSKAEDISHQTSGEERAFVWLNSFESFGFVLIWIISPEKIFNKDESSIKQFARIIIVSGLLLIALPWVINSTLGETNSTNEINYINYFAIYSISIICCLINTLITLVISNMNLANSKYINILVHNVVILSLLFLIQFTIAHLVLFISEELSRLFIVSLWMLFLAIFTISNYRGLKTVSHLEHSQMNLAFTLNITVTFLSIFGIKHFLHL